MDIYRVQAMRMEHCKVCICAGLIIEGVVYLRVDYREGLYMCRLQGGRMEH